MPPSTSANSPDRRRSRRPAATTDDDSAVGRSFERRTDWKRWAPGVALVLLTCAVYWSAPFQGYIWDDDYYVTGNDDLDDLAGLGRIWLKPTSSPQYYPLVFTGFWAEKRLWGLHPAGFHAVNVLLHATSALLVWRLLRRLAAPGAWWAAALFAVHPVHVESVVWITERKNVLSGTLYLVAMLALFAWSRAIEPREEASDPLARSRPARRWYVLALLAFGGALLSKSVTATLPAAFLLLRWMETGRVRPREIVATIPFFALGLAAGMHTAWLEVTHVGAGGGEFDLSLVERALLMCRTSWFYIQKLIVPWPIMFFYPRWEIRADDPTLWLFAASTIGLFAALILLRKRLGRGPLTGVLFFAGTILPASGIFNVYPFRFSYVADHFQYLASLGILATLAGLAAGAVARSEPGALPRRFAIGLGFVVLATLGALTMARVPIYRDALTLWEDTVAQNPASGGAWLNVGDERFRRGDLAGSDQAYREALTLDFDPDTAYRNLARNAMDRNDLDQAEALLKRALAIDPDDAAGWYSYGNVARALGDAQEAEKRYLRALELEPSYPPWFALGTIAYEQGRYAEAARRFEKALEFAPGDPDASFNLGAARRAARAESDVDNRGS